MYDRTCRILYRNCSLFFERFLCSAFVEIYLANKFYDDDIKGVDLADLNVQKLRAMERLRRTCMFAHFGISMRIDFLQI